ncbi:MAG: esterase-like activity of phytase family protein [Heteroscytonema crispum UTEX LB 1556]
MTKFLTSRLIFTPAIILSLLLKSHCLAAELVGRAVLSADTFAPGETSGQFKKTNRTVPFLNSQPVQGFSAVVPGPKSGTYLVISDNGFGSKANSPDYVLRIYAVEPDFATGKVFPVNLQTGERLNFFSRQSFLELNDRNSKVNFPIIAEGNVYPASTISVSSPIKKNRLLTGGDFDIESFRKVSDGTYWLGDEFGPFLLHVGLEGELLNSPIPLPNFLGIGKLNFVKSPDNPEFANLPNEARATAANLGGSKGFEGMALNTSGTKLYPMLEGALNQDSRQNRLLIHEFDLATKQYTGKVFSYQLENPRHAIGELTAINDNEFIVIERDRNQGDRNNSAFKMPAQFKRLYKINLNNIDKQGFVEKFLLVDLLNISDPKGIGGNGTTNGIFTFPFVTIESVLPINASTLLIINDNNYADSIGRTPGQVDNTEFIIIRLGKPLALAMP